MSISSSSSEQEAQPNSEKVTVRIRQEPIKLENGTELDPEITIVLCGGGRDAVRCFFGKYFGDRPWFITDTDRASYAGDKENNNSEQSSEPSMKRPRFSPDVNNNNNSDSNSDNNKPIALLGK